MGIKLIPQGILPNGNLIVSSVLLLYSLFLWKYYQMSFKKLEAYLTLFEFYSPPFVGWNNK
jgi:hypothetical protein